MGNNDSKPSRDVIDETQASDKRGKSDWDSMRYLRGESTRDVPMKKRASDHTQSFQGSSKETFHAFLQKAVRLDIRKYKSVNELKRTLYDIYSPNTEAIKKIKIKNKDNKAYKNALDNSLEKAFEGTQVPTSIRKLGVSQGYLQFAHTINPKDTTTSPMNVSFNFKPDNIEEQFPTILRDIATLPYVTKVKVAYDKKLATVRRDNIVVYFYNSADGGNKNQLEQHLRNYGEYTRPDNPPMKAPIEGIQGIVSADQKWAKVEKRGWGMTRIRHIADIMWDLSLRKEEISFEKLLPKVQERFRENHIDPEHPERDLPETQATVASSSQAG